MRQRIVRLAAVLYSAAVYASDPSAAAQTYRVMNLSSLVSGGVVVGMNKSGQLAGNLPTGGGFVYSNGTLTLIPGIGGKQSRANAINKLGQVTGSSNNHAFIYSNGVTADIGALPTVDVPPTDGIAEGLGINDSGQVTGYSILQPNSIYAYAYSATAFLFSNGVMTNLGIPGGTSTGRAINNAGAIAGGVGSDGAKRPFLYQNGVVTLIGPPNSDNERGDIAYAAAINDAGDVVGQLIDGSQTNPIRAFVYSNGTLTDLTALGATGAATAINNVGQVLGGLNSAPYLYSGGMVTALSSLIDQTDPLVGVVVLNSGVAIADDGSILVTGNPSVFNHTDTSYLLTPQKVIFSPTRLDFGSQVFGTVSPKQTVTINNGATASIPITSVVASGDFGLTNNCWASLAPGASCTIDATFTPTAVGTRTGTLTVVADVTYVVALSGVGAIGVTLTASTSTVPVNTSFTLSWSSTPPSSCTNSGGSAGDQWNGPAAASASIPIKEGAAGTYTYMVTCASNGQSAQAQAVVKVTPAPAGGGGGAVGWPSIVALACLGWRLARRRMAQPGV